MSAAQFATVDGVRLRYRLAGDGPLLVVQPPGWGIGGGTYEHTLAPLETFATALYYDPRCSGESDRDVDPASLNVGQFVADLEGLRSALEIPAFDLLGHSHGAYIALNYALAYPQHVSHLVLIGAQIGAAGGPSEDFEQRLAALARKPEYADAVVAFTSPWDFTTDAEMGAFLSRILPLYFRDVAKVQAVIAGMQTSPPSLRAMQTTLATDGAFTVLERLSEIVAPALVAVGRHDFICPPSSAELLHAGLPNSRLAVFEESGHFPWIEEPDAFFADVRSFLER